MKVRRILSSILNKREDVSIHAPVKVRRDPKAIYEPVEGFNPRTREGATLQEEKATQFQGVSIHAPVKVRHSWQVIGSTR